MKLFWCFLATLIVHAINAAIDVEKTVQQVQAILKANSLLPRLSRDEIISLLNDIKAEDAKSASTSKEKSNEIVTAYSNTKENEIDSASPALEILENNSTSSTDSTNLVETTTKHSGPTLTVVLPYTPRDGSSLQELYTRPPRLEVVAEKVTPKPVKTSNTNKNIQETLTNNAKIANKQKFEIPNDLQAFLDSHGLKGPIGEEHFLLPLEGFKPLPPARIVDGEVQLPENILLTYDLISPSDLKSFKSKDNVPANSQNSFLYEPLRPDFPFELDTASSDSKQTVLPLDLPKPRKPKATANKPNYEPIDYDSIKVIPLNQGPSPIEESLTLDTDQSKRQTNESDDSSTNATSTDSTTNSDIDLPDVITTAPDTAASDTDSGALIADLEDSFGGAAPEEPGDSVIPPPKKNGFYWMVDWNSFLEVGDGDSKVNIRFEPKLGDPQMFLPVNVP